MKIASKLTELQRPEGCFVRSAMATRTLNPLSWTCTGTNVYADVEPSHLDSYKFVAGQNTDYSLHEYISHG